MKKLHDAHVHFDLNSFNNDNMIYVNENKIYSMIMTTVPSQFKKLSEYNSGFYRKIALGFHPELIYKYKSMIPLMWKYLDKAKYIGEIGLDFSTSDEEDRKCQVNFMNSLFMKMNSGKIKRIVSVHSRKAEFELLEMIPEKRKFDIIMHWYTGPLYLIEKYIDKDVYFSFNIKQLKSKKGINLLKIVPSNRILIESDYPFTVYGESVYDENILISVIKVVSDILQIDAREIISSNFSTLINKVNNA